MTKSNQHARSLLLIPKPNYRYFCPSSPNRTRLPTNDVASCSVSSVVKTRMGGVNLIGEEMEMEMGIRWRERKNVDVRLDVKVQVKGKGREEEKEDVTLTDTRGRNEKELEKKVEREKSVDEIWNGVWT
ncbi:predicted protein [Sclerotinia sclerotiorum 1980 UF-70]|uniref:Uncharacterized protein n=1 Tax=Sclerotinia sclerotiorum (strain ATCC 18683 / 1980 / Ss-1) TaxID=665079 RepID=A7F9A5_SCLS1|nr:predicted protein [Sclerotinia sclerotiorum 1980 UF-70]EDO00316.1 predicted protein [Sclerotinia sclerotiorum 1980 UF-70]